MHLVGEPASLIQSCSAYPNKSEGYYRALELLNYRYGNSFRFRNKVKEELVLDPPIKDSDTIQLNYLATKMNSCKCLFEANSKLSELTVLEILRALLNRLSVRMQERFAEISFKREIAGESATFLDLVNFVSRAARFAETELTQQLFRAQGEEARSMGKIRKLETRKHTSKSLPWFKIHLKRVRALQLRVVFSVKVSIDFGNVENLLTNLYLYVSVFLCRTICALLS